MTLSQTCFSRVPILLLNSPYYSSVDNEDDHGLSFESYGLLEGLEAQPLPNEIDPLISYESTISPGNVLHIPLRMICHA
jgi:hypothetical protein